MTITSMKRYVRFLSLFLALAVALVLTGCRTAEQDTVNVTLVVEGTSRTLAVTTDFTVDDVLRQAGVTLGVLDRVNPQRHNRVAEGMTITIVRVVEETVAVQETVPFTTQTTLNASLAAGERQVLQAGVNGVAEVTYRITYEDGVEVSRSEIRRVVITVPQNEVIMVGSQGELPAVTVNGTLAYISGGNAYIIRGNSTDSRPLTLDGGLDKRVFELSDDGKRLLFTRSPAQVQTTPTEGPSLTTATPQPTPGGPFNTLWAVLDTTDPESKPVNLNLSNILFADWVPGSEDQIVYSTAEPRPNFPGWQANNDLWRASVSDRGRVSGFKLLLEPSGGGIYGWYGTVFSFSPDGEMLAWAQPDAMGVLRPGQPETEGTTSPPDTYERETLVTFAPRNAYDFVWTPSLSWSSDGSLVATTTHGQPFGGEAPEDSPIYNLKIVPAQGGYEIDLVERVGLWAAPQFSPTVASDGTELIAYLQAMQPLDSVVSRYQLAVVDRDGSNRRVLFPPNDQPGLVPQIVAWSPDGLQIALIYQGNLYLLDIESGVTHQVTQDGLSSSPRWTP